MEMATFSYWYHLPQRKYWKNHQILDIIYMLEDKRPSLNLDAFLAAYQKS